MKPLVLSLATIAALLSARPASAAARPWGKCPGWIREMADKADRITRGKSSRGVMTMRVFKRGTVRMKMKYWSRGRDKFLAKILRPSRLRGMATLKSGNSLWNYLPRLDRIVKLGSSMMGGSWMGSHFTNDDLVKETDMRVHYGCSRYREKEGKVWITATPNPGAPVVWGKIVMKIKREGTIPVWTRYYDEQGALKRTMFFRRIKKIDGRIIPTKMVLQPTDAPSERTELTFTRMRFNIGISSRYFTLRGLKR